MLCLVRVAKLWLGNSHFGEIFSQKKTPKCCLSWYPSGLWVGESKVNRKRSQGFVSGKRASSAVNTSPLTGGHNATRPASVPWLPPFNWLCTKLSWLPERTLSSYYHSQHGATRRQTGRESHRRVYLLNGLSSLSALHYYYVLLLLLVLREKYFELEYYQRFKNSRLSVAVIEFMSESYSYVLKTSKNTFSVAPLFEHVLLFCNTKLQGLIRFFFFVKIYLASLTWRHGVGDKVRVRVRIGGYHLWIQTSKREGGEGGGCLAEAWEFLETAGVREGTCRDKYSEILTGERPSVRDLMNKHFFSSLPAPLQLQTISK